MRTQPNAEPHQIRPACTCRCTQPCAQNRCSQNVNSIFPYILSLHHILCSNRFAWRLFLLLSFFNRRVIHGPTTTRTDTIINNNYKKNKSIPTRKRNQKTALLYSLVLWRSTFGGFFCLNWKTNGRDSGYGRARITLQHVERETRHENQIIFFWKLLSLWTAALTIHRTLGTLTHAFIVHRQAHIVLADWRKESIDQKLKIVNLNAKERKLMEEVRREW